MNKRNILPIAICTWLLLTTSAMAHKVNLFAYLENGTVYVEGYFPDGQPVTNGNIEVFDSNKQKLLKGKTNTKGLFSFPVPVLDNLTIVINASMGHRSEFHLDKNDLK